MIYLPTAIWDQMLQIFARQRRYTEQVAYFDGVRTAGAGIVTTLTLPDANLSGQGFHVSSDAMTEAGAHLRTLHLSRLAQVHTHPERWVGHSVWDDTRAYSQQPGALSIVLPFYGRGKPNLPQVGIHVRTPDGWQQLSAEEVGSIIQVVPSKLDFRRKTKKK